MSLSAIIAALCRILNIPCPDTLIATGSFRDNELQTVGEDTLWQKIVAASRYGYQKLILVEGQKGEWNNVSMSPEELRKTLQEEKILPQDTALRFMEVPQEPLKAFFRILREMPHGAAEEMAILLAAFDKKYLRSDPAHGEEDFLNTVLPFVQSPCNLVRHVALDILCRRELHLGNTPQAEVYRREIPTLRPSEFPPGRLGYYLKYEEAASKAVLDLDLGNWDADHSDHQLLERILVRLKSSVRDGLADIEEIRNAMAIANTKGRRLMFQGRLSENPIFLKEAWNEFICFEEYWEEIFKYAAKLGLPNENMRRQRNQCVECIADYWYLTREVLQCPRLCLEIPFEKENNYDIAAELSWRVTQNPPEAIPAAPLLKNADRNYESWKGYPNFLPYEKVLIYGLGDASDREHARQQLSEASHLKEPFERSGILALLGMRSAYVLENMGLVYQIYHELADGNPLRKVAEKMMEEPENMVFRCPY